MIQINNDNRAIVIAIKDRYFHSFGKKDRLATAYSLSGAKMYHPYYLTYLYQSPYSKTIDLLRKKKIKYEIIIISHQY
ncbi:hypothetical protein ACNQGF_10630 [Flavobacterium sp. LB1P71]